MNPPCQYNLFDYVAAGLWIAATVFILVMAYDVWRTRP